MTAPTSESKPAGSEAGTGLRQLLPMLVGAVVIGGLFLWLGGGESAPRSEEPASEEGSGAPGPHAPGQGPTLTPETAVRLAARQMREALTRFGDANIATGLAMRTLGPVLPKDARPVLRAWLGDADPTVRWAGLVLVHRYGPADPQLVKQLLVLTYDKDAHVERAALRTLESLREATDGAVALIERGMATSEGDRRAVLLRALVRCRPRARGIETRLVESLRADNVRLRRAAAYGFGTRDFTPPEGEPFPHGAVIAPLRTALGDADPEVRMYVAMALSRMMHEAAPALPELLDRLADPVEYVSAWVSTAVERMGDIALPGVRARFWRGEHPPMKHLVWILRRSGHEMGGPVLRAALIIGDRYVRTWAASGLVDLDARDPAVMETLLEGLAGGVHKVERSRGAQPSELGVLPWHRQVRERLDAEHEWATRIVALRAVSRLGVAHPEFKAWLRGLAVHPRRSVASLARTALVPYGSEKERDR